MKVSIGGSVLPALLALGLAGASGSAVGDSATTTGGIRIKTDDGKFEAAIGGRIQVDTVIFDDDRLARAGVFSSTSGVYLRRTYLTLTGKLYGWSYKFENDFSAGASPGSFRDIYIGHSLFGGELLIGQAKPQRSIEEQTSDLDTLLLERSFINLAVFASNANRTYQPGLFYRHAVGAGLIGASVYNANHAVGTAPGQGFGTSERFTYPVINTKQTVVHLGVYGGVDTYSKGSPGAQSVAYAGRSSGGSQVVGPTQIISTVGNGASQSFYGFEGAAQTGSFFVQGEYLRSNYGSARGPGLDDEVESYYLQGSWYVTGEQRVYKTDRGVFTVAKPKQSYGAFELVARYDSIENKDRNASIGTGVCQAAAAVVRTGAACHAKQYSGGLNWYANPAIVVKADYVRGDNDVTGDETGSYNLRVQLAF